MYNNKTFLAIIPARGGSKRLPRKNILELNGRPLIAWTIDAALRSKYIDKLIVSTDDEEIRELSQHYGADTINRPAEIANDTATTVAVVKHTIENYKSHDFLVLLQPTSPLRNEKHIDDAIELLFEKNADSIVSVCEAEHSPLWFNTLPPNNNLENFMREDVKNKRSQDLEPYYRLNGAIYIWNTLCFLEEKSTMFKRNTFAYKMARDDSIDIDTALDFQYTEFLFKQRNSNN